MRYEEPLLEGKLLKRYKRFLADVKLKSGKEITVHCNNSGSLLGISAPGTKVLLSETNSTKRKFKHQLEIMFTGKTLVGVHSGRPITLTTEAIMGGKMHQLAGYATLKAAPKANRQARIPIVLEGNGLRQCYLAVENVTLERSGFAHFPDAKHPQGLALINSLTNLVREGNRSMLVFVVQRSDVQGLKLADSLDNDYCERLRDAAARGVELVAFTTKVSRKAIEFDREIPVQLD